MESFQLNQLNQPRTREPFLWSEPVILAITVGLVIFSIIMVYSTTGVVAQEKFGDPYYFVKRQIAGAGLGFLGMILCSWIPLEVLKKISPFLYPLCVGLLGFILLPGVGHTAGGAQRWINLGIIRFQPGELVKLAFIVFAAGFFARHEEKLSSFFQGVFIPSGLIALIGGLFLLQPDFGSFVVVALVTLLMGAVSGVRFRHMLLCAFAGGLILAALVVISPYRMARVVTFMNPFADPSGKGYQLIQSLIAVGSGQWTGAGIGGSQQKLFFLPAAHTDFIFAVIGEELGFVGCVALILVFLIFLWRGLLTARKVSGNTFAFALSVGLTLMIVIPALFNTGVVTGLLPTKGMVLPLVGYGGSSLVISLMAIGLLLGINRHHQRGLIQSERSR